MPAHRRRWAGGALAGAVGLWAVALGTAWNRDSAASILAGARRSSGDAWPDHSHALPAAFAHVGRRPQMEDHTALLSPSGGGVTYVAVIDGHEGDGAAAAVSAGLLPATAAALEAAASAAAATPWWRRRPGSGRSTVEAALLEAAASVDTAWLAGPGRADGSGATAAWAVAPPDRAAVAAAWVGDAALILCRSGGLPPLKLSTDHALADPAEAARVAAATGGRAGSSPQHTARLAGELAVTRAFGDAPYRRAGLVSTPGLAWVDGGDESAVALLLVTDGALEGRAGPAGLCRAAVRGAAAAAGGAACDPSAALAAAARRSGAIALGGEVAPAAAPARQPDEQEQEQEQEEEEEEEEGGGEGAARPTTPPPPALAARAAVCAALAGGSGDNAAAGVLPLAGWGAALAAEQAAVPTPGSLTTTTSSVRGYALTARLPPAPAPAGWRGGGGGGPRRARTRWLPPWLRRRDGTAPPPPSSALALARSSAVACVAKDGSGPPAQAGGVCAPRSAADAAAAAAVDPARPALPGPVPPDASARHNLAGLVAAARGFLLGGGRGSSEMTATTTATPPLPSSPPPPPPATAAPFALGGSGEVYRATRGGRPYVLKRLTGPSADAAAAREAAYGRLLLARNASPHLARLVDAFPDGPADRWLVFEDEGTSLASLMYVPLAGGGGGGGDGGGSDGGAGANNNNAGAPLGRSPWWRAALLPGAGGRPPLARDLLRQLFTALAALEAAGVSHRDVKPANLLVRQEEGGEGGGSGGGDPALLRLADFGSARGGGVPDPPEADDDAGTWAAGSVTREYAPPEARLGPAAAGGLRAGGGGDGGSSARQPPPIIPIHAADAWAAGVTMLELLAGLPDPLAPSPRGAAALRARLGSGGGGGGGVEGGPGCQPDPGAALFLTGLMELCVYEGVSAEPAAATAVPWACSDGAVAAGLAARAGGGGGAGDGDAAWPPMPLLGLRLARSLLAMDPAARPTPAQALRHAYFAAGEACSGADREVEGWC